MRREVIVNRDRLVDVRARNSDVVKMEPPRVLTPRVQTAHLAVLVPEQPLVVVRMELQLVQMRLGVIVVLLENVNLANMDAVQELLLARLILLVQIVVIVPPMVV